MTKTWIKAVASMLSGVACAVAQAGMMALDATPGWFDGDSGTRVLRIGEHGIAGDVTRDIDVAKCNDPGNAGNDGFRPTK